MPWPDRYGNFRLYLLSLCLLALPGLTGSWALRAGENELVVTQEELERDAPILEAVKKHVARLAECGSRVPGSEGHERARRYVIDTLRETGYFDGTQGAAVDGDAIPETALTAAAQSEQGQTFTVSGTPRLVPANLRIKISGSAEALLGGKLILDGVGLGGEPLREELAVAPAWAGQSITFSDKPFQKFTSLTLLGLQNTANGQVLSASYDTRYAIGRHQFWGVAPHDPGNGKLTFTAGVPAAGAPSEYPLYAVWPNGTAVTSTGAAGISGPVVYAGMGHLKDYDGLPLKESLILVDLDVAAESGGTQWTLAAGLGAKGIIFIEPEQALRPVLEKLFVASPVEFPRLWMPRKEGLALREALREAAGRKVYPTALAKTSMTWKSSLWENLYLLIPGTGAIHGRIKLNDKLEKYLSKNMPDAAELQAKTKRVTALLESTEDSKISYPELGEALRDLAEGLEAQNKPAELVREALQEVRADLESTVVIAASYDSNSVVPALAPGTEQALSCGALLELARLYKQRPPARNVMLVFYDGHFQALKGEREFFAEVERFDAAGQEQLPDSITNGALAKVRGNRENLSEILRRVAGVQAPANLEALTRETLLEASTQALEQYEGSGAQARDRRAIQAEQQSKGGISSGALFAGILLGVLGIFGLLLRKRLAEKGKAWPLLAGMSVAIGFVLLIHGALLPTLVQAFPSGGEIADASGCVEELLALWKEETTGRQSDLERALRQQRSAGKPGEELKGGSEEYEDAGLFLFSLTTNGPRARPPKDALVLRAKLFETAGLLQQRFKDELTWANREWERREANASFRALVQDRLSRAGETRTKRKSLFFSLDLSAGHPGLGLFYKGAFYNQPDVDPKFIGYWGQFVRTLARAVEKGAGAQKPGQLVPETLKKDRRPWDSHLGTALAHSAEVAIQTHIRGLNLATPYDRRMLWDTPQDLPSNSSLNWSNVESQLKLAGSMLRCFMAEASISDESRFEEGMKYTGFNQVIVEAVRRGGSRSIFPNLPVSDAIIQTSIGYGSAAGVRIEMREATSPLGKARITGIRKRLKISMEVNKCDPESGEITYAINKPRQGLDENKPFSSSIGTTRTRKETVELFRAQGLAALDIVDPRFLMPLANCTILAGQTESKPLEYGSSYAFAQDESQNTLPEAHRVIFAEPGTRVKLLFREGQFGVRMAILDVDETLVFPALLNPATAPTVKPAEARGPGLTLAPNRKVIDWLPLRTARDLWSLSEQRLGELRSHSITNARLDNADFPGPYSTGTVSVLKGESFVTGAGVNWDAGVARQQLKIQGIPESFTVESLEGGRLRLEKPFEYASVLNRTFTLTNQEPGLHNLSKQQLYLAQEAKDAGRYSEAWQRATEAWALESRGYPEVLATAKDSVLGVVFYLFLLLPFCFFAERLFFAFPVIERQIAAFFALFVAMFCLLWLVHPAFNLIAAPPMILLAFIILSLAGIVVIIVYGKFNTEMRLMQQGMQGTLAADVNRASAGIVAISLGISQMRRRKLRTALTCITVIILTFTALSFTSLVESLSQASIDLSPGREQDAPYNGILLRQLNFDSLRSETYERMRADLEPSGIICVPRYWLASRKEGDPGRVTHRPVFHDLSTDSGHTATAMGLLGLAPEELRVFPRLQQTLSAGSWLGAGERNVCLLPEPLAKMLELGAQPGVDWKPDLAVGKTVHLAGLDLKVAGVFNPDAFREIRDLDGEELTPAEFTLSSASRGAGQTTQGSAEVENLESATISHYEHMNPAQMVILPWPVVSLLGGTLRSMAAPIEDPHLLEDRIGRLLKNVQKNLFVGRENRRQLYASTGKMSLAGLGNLAVPLLISVLILLNVMIGAVYERKREIGIFSALGLAPTHVAALFLAEAVVYATIGAILGYLLGQGVAMIVQLAGIEGLYLNYSSSSAVFVSGIVMLSVIGSTIYPATMAMREAAPSEERSWSVPVPVGDEISMELPFSFQRDLVPGVALFLHEYFDSHAESSLGKFTAKEVTLEAFHTAQGQGICLFFVNWLTPYDLGVSQETQIYIVPQSEGLYTSEASFFRLSGYVDSWRRVNLPFLHALRKHLLLWRAFLPQQRQEYAIRGYFQFQEAFEAVGWPPPEGFEPGPFDPDLLGPQGPLQPLSGAEGASAVPAIQGGT